ncbi:transporter [Geobacillus sp. Y412MC52]|uniref:transporter n=1 Tax=Geobacillus sp. (strain Y412MC52) TaxID=550542 RepID=UPI00018C0C4D|nr:transporter [Geobacillus sp. Y412MC52]ADU95568.1 MerE family protein [Geobacillus sp. Y412MC52]ALA70033.1 transporter [Geobacillus stearothermophilus 10]
MGMVKKSFWAVLALLSCPCHLAVILPLLAGTSVGAYLIRHQSLAIGFFTVLFFFSLMMMFGKRKPMRSGETESCGLGKTGNGHGVCCFPFRTNHEDE